MVHRAERRAEGIPIHTAEHPPHEHGREQKRHHATPERLLFAPVSRDDQRRFGIELNGDTEPLDAVALYTSEP